MEKRDEIQNKLKQMDLSLILNFSKVYQQIILLLHLLRTLKSLLTILTQVPLTKVSLQLLQKKFKLKNNAFFHFLEYSSNTSLSNVKSSQVAKVITSDPSISILLKLEVNFFRNDFYRQQK